MSASQKSVLMGAPRILTVGVPIKAYDKISFTTHPRLIEIMGIYTRLYDCKIPFVKVIMQESVTESDKMRSGSVIRLIATPCPENKSESISPEKRYIPRLMGIAMKNASESASLIYFFCPSLSFWAIFSASDGISGRAIAEISAGERAKSGRHIVVYEPYRKFALSEEYPIN